MVGFRAPGRGGGAHLYARLRAQRGDGAVQPHLLSGSNADQIITQACLSMDRSLLPSFDPLLGLLEVLLEQKGVNVSEKVEGFILDESRFAVGEGAGTI